VSAERTTRHTDIDRTCPICWDTFTPVQPRHTYCSQRCRKTAYQRRLAEQVPMTADLATSATSTAAPQPAAHRACPHCGETITIVALLTTPEAARPNLPAVGDSVIPLHRNNR
jgi:endogenous inhibitor of DNA gyrase (YacG/DUF329 family)